MGDPVFLFFALLLGYIGVAVWIGLGLGRWLGRHARRPVQILIQVLCVAVPLYLPVWDYIPGKILFDRHCAATGGLQFGRVPFSSTQPITVLFEGQQLGACSDCISTLAVRAIDVAEAYIDPPQKLVTLIPAKGYVSMTLVPRTPSQCALVTDYFERSPAYADKTEEQKWAMFWNGRVPDDFRDRLNEHCVTWMGIKDPTAEYVLKPRTQRKLPFFWTYLYETRVELQRRVDEALVASYSAYQYHPWFNTSVFEGPRFFIFRCPAPDASGWWSLSFSPSRLFIEMVRQRRSPTGSDEL